jgi:Na+-translocating ferredoxin:NAD+ oxidoreductase RnfG subunit
MNPRIKNMINSVVVLCLIATLSGLLLGFVNKFTYIDPLQESLNKFTKLSETQGTFELIAQDDGKVSFFAKSNDETPIYALLCQGSGGFGGTVKIYVIIIDNKIVKIAQGENKETYFKTIEKVNFYNNFYNIDLTSAEDFSTDKADLVSGATRTSTAVTNAVNNAKEYYNAFLEEQDVNDNEPSTGGIN